MIEDKIDNNLSIVYNRNILDIVWSEYECRQNRAGHSVINASGGEPRSGWSYLPLLHLLNYLNICLKQRLRI